MFTTYKLPTLIMMAVITPLISYYLTHNSREAAAYLAAVFMNVGNLYVITMYIAIMYYDYTTSRGHEPDTVEERMAQQRRIPNLANVEYPFTTQSVNWDAEKHFALTIVQQHAHGFQVNMTETYWLKAGRWMGTQDEFRSMLAKWRYHKIAAKQGGRLRGGWQVENWHKVRRIAAGEKLSPPPQPSPPPPKSWGSPLK